MSADIGVFHGSEIDDASLLPGVSSAWYIGAFGGEAVDVDSIRVPYSTQDDARRAMSAGAWLRQPCAWCIGVGGDPGQCLACNGKGYFLTESPRE